MVNITKDEICSTKYFIKKNINSGRFKLEELINNYDPKKKINSQKVYNSLEDFFIIQELIRKKVKSNLDSIDSLALSTIIAADYAKETLDYNTDKKEIFFQNSEIDFNLSLPYFVTDIMTTYCRSLTEITPVQQLEVLTDSFFQWTQTAANRILEGKDELIKSKLSVIRPSKCTISPDTDLFNNPNPS